MIGIFSADITGQILKDATWLAATQDPLTWPQISVLIGAATGFIAVVSLMLAVGWRARKEFGNKIDKLDLSIDNLTASLNDLRVATVSRTELDSFSTRLLKVEMQCVRVDANIVAVNQRIGKVEEYQRR